jgi:pyruvyl transferase EpsI
VKRICKFAHRVLNKGKILIYNCILQRKAKVFYLSSPTHSNGGDLAIAYGSRRWIKEYFSDKILIEVHEFDVTVKLHDLIKQCNKKDVIFLHGGGNLGDWYGYPEEFRRMVINAFPNNKIIIFPQTIFFSNTAKGIKCLRDSQENYLKHSDLTLITRGKMSYEFAKENFSFLKLLCCPDMFFYCDGYFNTSKQRNGKALLCLRHDIEKNIEGKDLEFIKNTLKQNNLDYSYQDTQLDNPTNEFILSLQSNYTIKSSEFAVEKLIDVFFQHQFVVTDRFHGVIFSYLTNTPCIALKSADHKIEEGVNWITDSNFIYYLGNDYSKIADYIKQATNVIPHKNKNIKEEYFVKLKENLGINENLNNNPHIQSLR